MAKKGSLIVISGFSGVGKGTVVKKMVAEYGYSLSVSATTRAPREGEVDGREYYFKSVDEFRNLIDYNGFIEWAQYVENYYGTPRKFVEDEMAKGHDVILEIEVQGAMNVREQYPDAILIFITAPSAKGLRERLAGRGTESEEVIDKRMQRAVEESEDPSFTMRRICAVVVCAVRLLRPAPTGRFTARTAGSISPADRPPSA